MYWKTKLIVFGLVVCMLFSFAEANVVLPDSINAKEDSILIEFASGSYNNPISCIYAQKMYLGKIDSGESVAENGYFRFEWFKDTLVDTLDTPDTFLISYFLDDTGDHPIKESKPRFDFTNNFNNDPEFINPLMDNYYLPDWSPCADASNLSPNSNLPDYIGAFPCFGDFGDCPHVYIEEDSDKYRLWNNILPHSVDTSIDKSDYLRLADRHYSDTLDFTYKSVLSEFRGEYDHLSSMNLYTVDYPESEVLYYTNDGEFYSVDPTDPEGSGKLTILSCETSDEEDIKSEVLVRDGVKYESSESDYLTVVLDPGYVNNYTNVVVDNIAKASHPDLEIEQMKNDSTYEDITTLYPRC